MPLVAFDSAVSRVWAVAVAEIRTAVRLVRTWVFLVLASLLVVIAFVFYTVLHASASGSIPFAGFLGPSYILGSLGTTMLWIFLVGAVFLAFDVRDRDVRERIWEVIDSRPISNVELLMGRLLGITVVLWLPVFGVLGLLSLIGVAMDALWEGIGGAPQAHTLFTFLVIDCLPSFLFYGAAMLLLAVTVRFRLAVVALALALIGLQITAGYLTPSYLLPVTAFVTAFVYLPSEVSPTIAEFPVLLQRMALILFAIGFVYWSAACYPRNESVSRSSRATIGAACVLAGACVITALVFAVIGEQEQIRQWKRVHASFQDEAAADLESIVGQVRIQPGERLELDLHLTVRLPPNASQNGLLLTLNPGLRVESVHVEKSAASFTHQDGILRIQGIPASSVESVTVALRAKGIPDGNFAYLDSPLDPAIQKFASSSLIVLGRESLSFRSSFVALLPGTHWLPTPGTAVRNLDPEAGPDFFVVDLTVDIPSGWDIAGPGLREPVANSSEALSFRFRPQAPMPMVGLVAGKYHRTSAVIDGVEVALLLDPDHLANLETLADAGEPIKAKIEEFLQAGRTHALDYPYGGITMVEVPNFLRIHGGGWDAPSIHSLPGILLLREHSFPTARFDAWHDVDQLFPSMAEFSLEMDHWKVRNLISYFGNDSLGGNLLLGFSKNSVAFQTSARGPGAPAIDFLVHRMAASLLTRQKDYFSAYSYLSSTEVGQEMMTKVWSTLFALRSPASLSSKMHDEATNPPEIWGQALATALKDLDYADDPGTAIEVIALKGSWASEALLDHFGPKKALALLAELRHRYSGTTYTYEELLAIAGELELDIEGILGNWLSDTGMAGFAASSARGVRLPDDEDGSPRFQTSIDIFNGEPTPGLFRLEYLTAKSFSAVGGTMTLSTSTRRLDPVLVAGQQSVRVNTMTDSPPGTFTLVPYLALNRDKFEIDAPQSFPDSEAGREPAPATEESEWRPEAIPGIVVDDLDAGFQVSSEPPQLRSGLADRVCRLFTKIPNMDEGLPVHDDSSPSTAWSRQTLPVSWGIYRKTVARAGAGRGHVPARFRAVLPSSGTWRLQYHVPRTADSVTAWVSAQVGAKDSSFANIVEIGEFSIRIESGNLFETLPFDFDGAAEGWNTIRDYKLEAGEAFVSVIPGAAGAIADAIRWLPTVELAPSGVGAERTAPANPDSLH